MVSMIPQDEEATGGDPIDMFDGMQSVGPGLRHFMEIPYDFTEAGGDDDASLDIFKAVLVYILSMEDSRHKEEIYASVFGGGKRILWN
jgi:hypothetical protein